MWGYWTGRDFGDEEDPIICPYNPELLLGAPIGMFHCPICGEMQLAGNRHLLPEDYVLTGLVIVLQDKPEDIDC